MKLRAVIKKNVEVNNKSIIVKFQSDESKQHFEVRWLFNPFSEGMRKWDSWDLKIKWESEIFTDEKTGIKSYFTHLICISAVPFCQVGNGK